MVQGSKPTYEGTRLGNARDATEETKEVSEQGRVKKLSGKANGKSRQGVRCSRFWRSYAKGGMTTSWESLEVEVTGRVDGYLVLLC